MTKKDSKAKEMENLLKHVQADFENYKKRVEKDKVCVKETATEYLMLKLLPVLDSFDLALKNKYHDGIQMIYSQFIGVLEENGLKIVPTEGMFNPVLHEALMVEESDKEKSTILEVFQKGYSLGSKLIRTAKVKVAK